MSKEDKKKLLGTLRIPNPPPDRPHSDKKGDKGYDRRKMKEELYNRLRDEEDYAD